ncbi:MAG: metal-sensitive transcriptional regulator [Candidatus Kaiserbacteria bacterium]|nr:metal-sensitive transcriptional regulator [Candidatus Kaiserbacteria bacterium]MCB9816472.1 metal-sensitive transcriptional regulator [Candidatus Nomurabacteria bacterium]
MDTDTKQLLNRLSRAEGQVRALRVALERGEVTDCKAFMSQIKAARSALKHTSEQFVLQHIHKCQALPSAKRDEQIAEALKVLASD